MTHFHDSAARTPKELLPGVVLRTFWGDNVLLTLVDLAPGAVIPLHGHPHEQITTVVSGGLTMTIAGETRQCGPGAVAVIPSGVSHSVINGPAPSRVIDAFSPVREEYKFPD